MSGTASVAAPVRIIVGDVRDALRSLPAASVHCVITSPPYYGLRDYGTAQWGGGDPGCDHLAALPRTKTSTLGKIPGYRDNLPDDNAAYVALRSQYRSTCAKCGAVRMDNQIGLEPTLAAYLATLVDVFREVRRVLHPTGVCFVNIGDSYAGSSQTGGSGKETITGGKTNQQITMHTGKRDMPAGMKPKDLMMVPARLAIALQDDGWWVRSQIIWHKRAPMPESVTDRPTSAHESIFLLTKSAKYFYDATAVAEPANYEVVAQGKLGAVGVTGRNDAPSAAVSHTRFNPNATRNLRNVWTLSPEPTKSNHYASFPTEIPRRAIRAGTSERGVCSACGNPWARVVEREPGVAEAHARQKHLQSAKSTLSLSGNGSKEWAERGSKRQPLGWQPTCACGAPTVPATVLDPFAGSGTTCLVASQLGRASIGIELSPVYAEMARRRIVDDAPMFADVTVGGIAS